VPQRRANRHAFWLAAAVGVVVWFAADVAESYLAPRTEAFMAGEALAVAIVSSLLVGVIAFVSRSRWPGWRYPVAVGALGACVAVPTLLPHGSVVDGHATAAAAAPAPTAGQAPGTTADPTPAPVRRTATAPAAVGSWTRDDSPAARARVQQAQDQYAGRLADTGGTAELALYRKGARQAVLVLVTTQPGSELDDETEDPEQTVVDELGGAGVDDHAMADPGALGGALACGPSTKDHRLYLCAWSELGLTGTLLLLDAHTTPADAAQLTRDFRAGSEH
jgi:hypothetical protein